MGEQETNAKYVLKTGIPERFEWQSSKKTEPDWFQKWIREKALYIMRIAKTTGRLPDMIMYWKMEKIRRVFPEDTLKKIKKIKKNGRIKWQ